MNRTQKGAWFGMAGSLTGLMLLLYGFIIFFYFEGNFPKSLLGRYWPVVVFIFFIAALIIFIRKKQSPVEPDYDERDAAIKQTALRYSYFSIWPLLLAAYIIIVRIVGLKGSVPVCILPLILIPVFVIVHAVYCAVVLIQYGRGNCNGGK